MPNNKPSIVKIPKMNYIAVRGKDKLHFISIIRLLDFVTKEDFKWAIEEATTRVLN